MLSAKNRDLSDRAGPGLPGRGEAQTTLDYRQVGKADTGTPARTRPLTQRTRNPRGPKTPETLLRSGATSCGRQDLREAGTAPYRPENLQNPCTARRKPRDLLRRAPPRVKPVPVAGKGFRVVCCFGHRAQQTLNNTLQLPGNSRNRCFADQLVGLPRLPSPRTVHAGYF